MIAEKVATMEYILYFCTVKSSSDTKSLPKMQRFLCPNLISKNIAVSCGVTVMSPRFRLMSLTARNTASFMSNYQV